jgi:hypothetical protein
MNKRLFRKNTGSNAVRGIEPGAYINVMAVIEENSQ